MAAPLVSVLIRSMGRPTLGRALGSIAAQDPLSLMARLQIQHH